MAAENKTDSNSLHDLTISQIPIDRIDCVSNVRTTANDAELRELAGSIDAGGLQQPICVLPMEDRYRLIFGWRRWRACSLLNWETIPAFVIKHEMSEVDILQHNLIENLQRVDLTIREKSVGIHQFLSKPGMTAKQVAAKLGCSASNVTKFASIAGLPTWILDLIDAGRVSLTEAYELSQITDPQTRATLAEKVSSGQLTRNELVAAKRITAEAEEVPSVLGVVGCKQRATATLDATRSITFSGAGIDSVDRLISWMEELLARARKSRKLTLGTFLRTLRDESKSLHKGAN